MLSVTFYVLVCLMPLCWVSLCWVLYPSLFQISLLLVIHKENINYALLNEKTVTSLSKSGNGSPRISVMAAFVDENNPLDIKSEFSITYSSNLVVFKAKLFWFPTQLPRMVLTKTKETKRITDEERQTHMRTSKQMNRKTHDLT
jgi:hypothetical protein